MPYSLHPYQYAYSAPTMWTDPSGRFVDCSAYPNHPQCSIDAYDGWHETDPEQGRRDTSITVDFIPVVGDGKGFVECIAGHDLITGDPLAWWERMLGCICLKEVGTTATIGGSILGAGRHADDAADAARHADEAADAADAAGSVLRRIDPHQVRFSQRAISYRFKNGGTIDEMAAGLRDGSIKPEDIPPIRLVERNGMLYTIDNRRLEAFRRAGVEVPYRMATRREIRRNQFKFDRDAAETSIIVRGEP
jgi:hypothetical protein